MKGTIIYIILLLITAVIAYFFGSLDSRVIASVYVFRRNLAKLGKGNVWFSNFRRVYGFKGLLKLLLVELIKDFLPIVIGGLLLGIKGHGDVGRAFAGFCMVLGAAFPLIYRFKGKSAALVLVISALCSELSMGVAAAMVLLVLCLVTRYVALASVVAALAVVIVSVLMLENNLVMLLCILTSAVVIVKHLPAVNRVLHGKEPKLSFREDISYKFDEKF